MKNCLTEFYQLQDPLHREQLRDIKEDDRYKEFFKKVPNVVLVGLGGSFSYGTEVEDSDIDLRGIYINPIEEFVGIKDTRDHYMSDELDVDIYSIKKAFYQFSKCNPNYIELLGLRDCDYLYKSEIGQMILDNKEIFLSKIAAESFCKYGLSMINALLHNGGGIDKDIKEVEKNSLEKLLITLRSKHPETAKKLNVYIDNGKIYIDMDFEHCEIKEVSEILSQVDNVRKDYAKNIRNVKGIQKKKLPKHMEHIIRLYMMGIDILSRGELITYRENEHELLMDIRTGKYLDKKSQCIPIPQYAKLFKEYKEAFDEAAANSKLPDKPDYDAINKLHQNIIEYYYYNRG